MDSLVALVPSRSPLEIVETFPKTFGLALVEHGTRCGKPGCRCTRGKLHPTAYLRWRENGSQRRHYIRQSEREQVRAIIDQRREARVQERLEHEVSMMTWRQLSRVVEDCEARLREHQEQQ